MAITYPLTLPDTADLSYRSFSLTLDYAQSESMSPFTMREQIFSYEAERWVLQVQYPPLTIAQAKILRGFILSLKGRIGTFKAGDPMKSLPAGSPTGTPLVNGNGQSGYSLNVKGLTPSIPVAFAIGDDIEINNSLYTVVTNTGSNGSGNATLDIQPSIRGTITDGMAINTNSPRGIFRMQEARTGWSGNSDKIYDISISAVEAL